MKRTVLKVILATLGFALVHSLLASLEAEKTWTKLFGRRARNAFYRPFYLVQSVVTGTVLLLYLRRLPDQVLYRARGAWVVLLRLGQLAGLAWAVAAAAQIGFTRVLGLNGLFAWLRGADQVPPEPEAQGPALDAAGELATNGPFALSRHPLNFAPLPIFWLMPTMTLKLLVFNVVATAYLILGSVHEEQRLEAAYGPMYRAYQRDGVSFYVPRLTISQPRSITSVEQRG